MSSSPRALPGTVAIVQRFARAPRTLWRRLLWLAIAAIVPLALIAGVVGAALLLQQRAQAERAALDFTRAFANAIEAELGSSIAVLQVLAASPLLDRGDAAAFRDLALRTLQTLPNWRAVILADPAGRIVAHTSADIASAPSLVEPASFQRALDERRPIVGHLARGPAGRWGVALRYPVLRDGRVSYVLSGVITPETIVEVVQRQRVPDDWVVSVFDAREARVARSRAHKASVGGAPSPSLHELIASGAAEGSGVTQALEGDRIYTAFVRLPAYGWIVAAGLPTAAFERGLARALAGYGGAIALSLLLALWLALRLARRIDAPIAELTQAAHALGRGEEPAMPHTDIVEVNEVAQALAGAAHEQARNRTERDALLDAERRARALAEAARARLELLAGSGASLARTLASTTVLDTLAGTVVPALADCCVIDLVDDDGKLQTAVVRHADPSRQQELQSLSAMLEPDATSEGSTAWAVRHGRACLLRFASAAAFDRIPDAASRRFAEAIDLRVHYVVPLMGRGRTLGAMAVAQAAASGRDLGPDDRALLGELAQRAALALDNAWLYAQAEQARAQAESANRAKDEFLAMLGHELRNPLAPIVSALQLMKLRHPDAGRERGIIERQVEHLSRLVDDLLDVSRIVQGKVPLDTGRIDLRRVIDKALEIGEPLFAARAPLRIELPDAAVFVDGDEVRLVQVVCNLLGNAVKFTPPDGAIELCLCVEGQQAVVMVSDRGIGIEAALLPRVFDLFVQGEQALDRGGGLGLGLGIVRMLLELHGGSVSAESPGPGGGSRFTVRLPRVEAPAAPAALPSAPAPQRRAGRVLLVDDNIDAAAALAELLRCTGYDVSEAHDGPAALAALDRFTPDIALLDIGLPGMDGYELAAALRADPRLDGLTIVALTGYGREQDRERALAGDFDEHLVKPVSIDALLALLAARASS